MNMPPGALPISSRRALGDRVKQDVAWPERVLFVLFLTFVITGGLPFKSRAAGAYTVFDAGGTLLFGIFFAATALVAAYFVFMRHRIRMLTATSIPLLLLFAWAGLSIAWSFSPMESLNKYIGMLAVAAATIGFTISYKSPVNLMKLLFYVFLGALLVNYLTVIVSPGLGIHQAGDATEPNIAGDWRGMMLHKNLASYVSVIGAMVAFCLAREFKNHKDRWIYLTSFPFFVFFAFMAGGKTTTIIGAFAMIVAPMIVSALKHRYGTLIVATCTALLGALASIIIIGVGPSNILIRLFGDATLTGRTIIWHYLLEIYKQRPIFGAGYESIWGYVNNLPLAQSALNDYVKLVSNSHNTYIDTLASLGTVGFILLIPAFLLVPLKRIKEAKAFSNAKIFFLAVWLHALLIGLTDIVFLKQMRMQWVFLLIAYAGLTLCAPRSSGSNAQQSRVASRSPKAAA